MKELEALVTKCVLRNVMFEGSMGASSYTVQDLVHVVALATLNKMWVRAKKELASLDSDSLFENPSTVRKSALQIKVDTLEAIFRYKQKKEEDAKNKAKLREEAQARLVALKSIKTEKELKQLGKLSLKDLEAQIAEAESLV